MKILEVAFQIPAAPTHGRCPYCNKADAKPETHISEYRCPRRSAYLENEWRQRPR